MQDLKHQAKVKIRNNSQTIDKLCPSVMFANWQIMPYYLSSILVLDRGGLDQVSIGKWILLKPNLQKSD